MSAKDDAYKLVGQLPHCDGSILHPPTVCSYCDEHPLWQALREVWGINFTGESDPKKAPCPSERLRPTYIAHRWPGNRPTNKELTRRDLEPPTVYDRLNDDDGEEEDC